MSILVGKETPPLPPDLRAAIGRATWKDATFGYSGVRVFRLTGPTGETRYLKIAARDSPDTPLQEEAHVLDWLHGCLPVPRVLYLRLDAERVYLLLSAVPGRMSHDPQFADDLPRVVRLLAAGLRAIHAVGTGDCPFDRRLDGQLRVAHARTARGLVDEGDFDAEHQGRSVASLYDELLATRPTGEDLVFTHGDYCLPNVLLDDGIGGFIDWGRGGVADRYQDLALCARSLAHNWGPEQVPPFFTEYGMTDVDEAKLAFYRLLDAFS